MRLITLLLSLFCTLGAADFTALKPQGYVSDFAGVVDPGARAELERYCARLEQKTGVQLAFVTLDTLGGEPIEDVANAIYRAWGIGKQGKNEGALLLLVIRDRKHRLEVGYGLEPVIPDGFAGSLLREMRPALRAQHYGDALLIAAQTLGARIAQAKGVDLAEEDAPARRTRQREPVIPWPVLIGFGILVLLLLLGGGSSILPWIFLSSMSGRGGFGRSSGGGFGGYDSGGGFGGFGGGDSGGGGASSDW